MKAIEVMRIGRSLRRAALSAACSGGTPSSSWSLRELHDQDRVLAGEPHEHDQADLREDVAVAVRELDAGDGRQQHHRHDQDDRERQAQALVLRREHQEHQQHHQREDEHRGVAGDDLLVGELGPFEAHAVGQLLARKLLHRRLRLTGAEARAPGRR